MKLSIRKGFTRSELRGLLSRVKNADVSVDIVNFSRLAARVRFDSGAR
jgi:hypothetical protein